MQEEFLTSVAHIKRNFALTRILLLNALNLREDSCLVKLAFGCHDLQQLAHLRNGESGRLRTQLDTQLHQEMMRQQGHSHVVVPADPAGNFIMVQPQFTLALFDVRFQFMFQSGDVPRCDVQSGFPTARRKRRYRNMSDQAFNLVLSSDLDGKLYHLEHEVTL
jgi:hypothetical protein